MINNKYKTLFTVIAQAVEVAAEKAMEYNKKINNMSSYKTSKEMREKYANLYNHLSNKMKDYELTKQDYIDLSIGTIIVTSHIKEKIKEQQEALRGYAEDIIPKLQQVIKATDEEFSSIADELFSIQEDSNN